MRVCMCIYVLVACACAALRGRARCHTKHLASKERKPWPAPQCGSSPACTMSPPPLALQRARKLVQLPNQDRPPDKLSQREQGGDLGCIYVKRGVGSQGQEGLVTMHTHQEVSLPSAPTRKEGVVCTGKKRESARGISPKERTSPQVKSLPEKQSKRGPLVEREG